MNSPRPRDSNRSYSEAVMTGAGTALVDGGEHRPSALAGVRDPAGVRSSSPGERANASAIRSTSHDPTTDPRRQTSATSPTSMSYW